MPRTQKRKTKRKTGRPSLYSSEIEAEICGYIERGVAPSQATVLAGLSEDTYTRWRRNNKQFCGAIKKAEGNLMRRCLTLVLAAAHGSALVDPVTGEKVEYEGVWTAVSWLLERRFPEHFGRLDRHHIKAEGDGRMPLPEEYVKAVCRALGVNGTLQSITRRGK